MSDLTNPAGRASDAAGRYVAALLDLLGDGDPLVVQRQLLLRLRVLTEDLSAAELREPEAPGKWSVIQVIEHLADQETVNAVRLRSIIAEERPPLRGYDQDRWGAHLHYGNAKLPELFEELHMLRRRNLRLYESLTPAAWERVGVHGERGEESVRRLCELTAAHDLVHRRQIVRIRRILQKPEKHE